jgi:hypothetical protein
MRPRERRETGEQDLFRSRLDQIKRLRSIRSGACRTIVCDTKAYEAVLTAGAGFGSTASILAWGKGGATSLGLIDVGAATGGAGAGPSD